MILLTKEWNRVKTFFVVVVVEGGGKAAVFYFECVFRLHLEMSSPQLEM